MERLTEHSRRAMYMIARDQYLTTLLRKISGKDCLGHRYIQRESPITEKSLEACG